MALMESQKERFGAAFLQPQTQFSATYPALCGRHVCCGFRQSIASSK
jgi:hypothetical protein